MDEKSINPIRDQRDSRGNQKNEILNGIKVTNAVYRVLDFFPDGDPLKNKIKERAFAILENLTLSFSQTDWFSSQQQKAPSQLLGDIEILENYLRVGKAQGWIDSVNFLIIIKEYDDIKNSINFSRQTITHHIETTNDLTGESIESIGHNQESQLKNSQLVVVENYSGRQKKILQMLEKKGKAQVSDFIKELPNITKRTVRRDLDDLLKRDKIIRVGEWNQVFYKLLKNQG